MKKLIFLLIAVALLVSVNIYLDNKYFYLSLIGIMIMASSYYFIKEIKNIWRYFVAYMFNVRVTGFKKSIERPRLFIYITFGILSWFFLFQIFHFNSENTLYRSPYLAHTILIIYFLTYTLSTFLLHFSWTEEFEKTFIPKIKKIIIQGDEKDFQLKWRKEEDYQKIYERLYDSKIQFITLIDESDDIDNFEKGRQLFSKVMMEGKLPTKPIFKLNMDNIQTHYFFDQLKMDSTEFTLEKFLKVFKNKNKKASEGSITASYSKSKKNPKEKYSLDKIFKGLNT